MSRTERIFEACVKLLEKTAEKTDLTYEEVNVIIFVYLWPAVTAVMAVTIVILLMDR